MKIKHQYINVKMKVDFRLPTLLNVHYLRVWVGKKKRKAVMMFSSVQFSHSVVSNSLWPHGQEHARCPCSSPAPGTCSNSCPLSRLMPSNYLILCHPLFLLPSIFPSISVFSNESVLRIRWPTYWSFSFSISPSNEYSGLISFRIDCWIS